MRKDLIIIAAIMLVVVAVIVLAYAMFFVPASAGIVSVSTDKPLYHSNEVMDITIDVRSTGVMNNATLHFTGIENLYGDTLLKDMIPVNLSPGTNTISYKHQLPTCSHCAGLDPGDYQFNVTLEQNGTILSYTNHTIRIEQ
jgi:hypothetical protein